jgi:hypothetical protein
MSLKNKVSTIEKIIFIFYMAWNCLFLLSALFAILKNYEYLLYSFISFIGCSVAIIVLVILKAEQPQS